MPITYTSRIPAQTLHKLSTSISIKQTTSNYLIWKEQLQSMEGQSIESHIINEPPLISTDDDKINGSYEAFAQDTKNKVRSLITKLCISRKETFLSQTISNSSKVSVMNLLR